MQICRSFSLNVITKMVRFDSIIFCLFFICSACSLILCFHVPLPLPSSELFKWFFYILFCLLYWILAVILCNFRRLQQSSSINSNLSLLNITAFIQNIKTLKQHSSSYSPHPVLCAFIVIFYNYVYYWSHHVFLLLF